MTRMLRMFVLTMVVAAPLAAQDPAIAARMASVGGDPEAKACKVQPGHFLVSSGATYFQGAVGGQGPNRERQLKDGKRVLLQAITQSGQAGNPAAWYYLARVDLLTGDFPGADSALKKFVALRPDCATEAANVRGDVRAVLISADSFAKAGNPDSAMYLFRAAYAVYPTSAYAAYQIAELFKAKGQTDSATAYYEKAMAASTDSTPNARAIHGNSAFALGSIYYNAKDYPNAVRAFRIASQADPKDEDARKDLAIAFRAAGMPDSAKALDDAALKAAQASGAMTPDQTFDLGVAQFNDKKFADAAGSFEKVLAAQPYRHDVLANLANTYSAMDSLAQAASYGEKWAAVEPLNYDALALIAKTYKAIEDRQKARQKTRSFDAFTKLFALTVSLDPQGLTVDGANATLKLTARGRNGMDAAGKALKPSSIGVVVEFLDAGGAVVASQPAAVPALAPDATQDVTVTASGQGIVGWRYHKA